MGMVRGVTSALVLISVVMTSAMAADPAASNALQAFRDATSPVRMEFLQLQGRAATLNGVAGLEKLDAAIGEARKNAQTQFRGALSTVTGKPASAALLKEYFALWSAAVESVRPQLSESSLEYGARQVQAAARANEAWFRFEIESGFVARTTGAATTAEDAGEHVGAADSEVLAEEARGPSFTEFELARWDEVRESVVGAQKRCFLDSANSYSWCEAAARVCGKRHIAGVEPLEQCIARVFP